MNKYRKWSLLVIALAVISGYFCKNQAEEDKSDAPVAFNELVFSPQTKFDEMAKLLAAVPLPENSPLLAIAKTKEYQKYAEEVNTIWGKFENTHLKPVRDWVSGHDTKSCGTNVFYPFSGPDLLHAMTFYPEAKNIHMFALERTGGIPDPDLTKPEKEALKLYGLIKAIKSSLSYFYYITSQMATEVGDNEYSGVSSILLFTMGRLGYTVIDMYPVEVSPEGKLKKAAAGNADPMSIAIQFKKSANGSPVTLVYFRGDLSDEGLKAKPEMINYLKNSGHYATILKAASYIMYERAFDDIRYQILGQSKCLFSDASGIPYHYFLDGNWDVNLYGVYEGPIRQFKIRFDPMLYADMKTKSKEILPFDYGYRRNRGKSYLFFIKRKPAVPFSEYHFDGTSNIGETTYWEPKTEKFYWVYKPAPENIASDPDKKN